MSNNSKIDDLKNKVAKLNSVSPTFCLAKWLTSTTTLYNGFTHSCHHPSAHKISAEEVKNNPRGLHNTPIKIVARKDMLNGIQTKECDYCWNIENLKQEHFSDRHYKSASEGMGQWQNFQSVIDSGTGENINPTYLEVAFENICNFKCSYCSPDVSSRWMEEVAAHGGIKMPDGRILHDLEWMKKTGKFPIHHTENNPYIEAFWQWWPDLYQSLNTFRITGGEPLLSDNTWKILDYVIANPRKDFKLSINTNMGVPTKLIERLCDKINQLTGKIAEIVIFTSAESTGAQAEYSRWGLDWNLFVRNVEYFLSNTPDRVRLQFMTTVNILSVSTFDQFVRYIIDLRIKFNRSREQSRIGFNTAYLRWPRHQSITLLDPINRIAFAKKMRALSKEFSGDSRIHNLYYEEIDQIARLLDYMSSVEPDADALKEFSVFFDEYDRRRGCNLLQVFPELKPVYDKSHALRGVTNV